MMWSDAAGCEGLNMIFPTAIVDLWGAGDLTFHGCKGDTCVAEDWGKGRSWHWYRAGYNFKHGWPGALTAEDGYGYAKAVVSGCFHLECPFSKYNWSYNYACGARLQNFSGVLDWNKTQAEVIIGGHAARWGETTTTENWFYNSFPALAGVAEALWATEQQTQPTNANLTAANVRLKGVLCRMARVGAAQPFNATAIDGNRTFEWVGAKGFAFCQ
jgi:hypothetical protein